MLEKGIVPGTIKCCINMENYCLRLMFGDIDMSICRICEGPTSRFLFCTLLIRAKAHVAAQHGRLLLHGWCHDTYCNMIQPHAFPQHMLWHDTAECPRVKGVAAGQVRILSRGCYSNTMSQFACSPCFSAIHLPDLENYPV